MFICSDGHDIPKRELEKAGFIKVDGEIRTSRSGLILAHIYSKKLEEEGTIQVPRTNTGSSRLAIFIK